MSEITTKEQPHHDDIPCAETWDALKRPLRIGSKEIHNRIVYQPMEGCDGECDGTPGDLSIRRYKRFALGGPGVIWLEATAVLPEGRANPRQLMLNEKTLDSYKRLCGMIKESCLRENGFEPFVCVQLTHSGRQSRPNGTPEPLIAYHNELFEKARPVSSDRIVSDEYLRQVTDALIHGAELAEKAEFDAADIKCCHAYLLSELLSAYSREGSYGGSLENRTRVLREAVEGAVQRCGREFVISSRLNIYDGFPYPWGFGTEPDGSLTPNYAEACWLVRELQKGGLRLLDLTMGNPYVNPHVNRPYRKGPYVPPEPPMTGVERMLSGVRQVAAAVPELSVVASAMSYLGMDAPAAAAGCIEKGWFSLAGFGRMSFAYPDFAKDVCEKGHLDRWQICAACSKCTELMRNGGTTGCVLHDAQIYVPLYRNYVMEKET